MWIRRQPPLHLTYCLNVHPGEAWADILRAIREKTLLVRDRVAPGQPFGLGLRLGGHAARELSQPDTLAAFKEFLAEHSLYVFTINGFPFGSFHGSSVKEQVYAPDWQTAERADYTMQLIDLLAELLPEGVAGSISTVPGAFKPELKGAAGIGLIADHLFQCVKHAAQIRDRTGREIHLGLEPEPGCFLENTQETLDFFEKLLSRHAVKEQALRRHLGVCFDACHLAVQFESPTQSLIWLSDQGIRISKIQISAALAAENTPAGRQALQSFVEPVYLHQTTGRGEDGLMERWADLPPALAELANQSALRDIRVHFHVPLYWAGTEVFRSTRDELDDSFFRVARSVTDHWEIETYTFNVLPPNLKTDDLASSLADEYQWVLGRAHSLP